MQIHDGRQGKHIKGSSNYIDGNSYLLNGINLQELVNKYAGTGEIRRIKNTGKWINKQFLCTLIMWDMYLIMANM